MTTTTVGRVTAQGRVLEQGPGALGELRRSDDAVGSPAELRRRLAHDGYLFLPGYLDRPEVLTARAEILQALAGLGALVSDSAPGDALAATAFPSLGILSEQARASGALMSLLYGRRMLSLYEGLFGEDVRHYDFTWLRAIPPGPGTKPHGDSVFMNRGTTRQLTAWVPLGDVDRLLGGLVTLEGSHRLDDVRRDYGSLDVDTFCSNAAGEQSRWDGIISEDPQALRADLGLRWVTGDFAAGDLLTFTTYTLHMSLDNNTDRVRISCDSRYQRASEPADPRWVGERPTAHGPDSQRGVIC